MSQPIGPKPSGPTHPTPSSPGPKPKPGHLPTLGMVIRDAERTLRQATQILARQWDPTSGPSTDEDPWGPEAVDIYLGSAVADIRSALEELATITTLGLPPAGSAVQFAARQAQSCLSGGSSSHPNGHPGERLMPGLAAGALTPAREAIGAATPIAGLSHLASPHPEASGGLQPGLVDAAAPTSGGIDGSRRVPPHPEAGADFTLPKPQPWGDAW